MSSIDENPCKARLLCCCCFIIVRVGVITSIQHLIHTHTSTLLVCDCVRVCLYSNSDAVQSISVARERKRPRPNRRLCRSRSLCSTMGTRHTDKHTLSQPISPSPCRHERAHPYYCCCVLSVAAAAALRSQPLPASGLVMKNPRNSTQAALSRAIPTSFFVVFSPRSSCGRVCRLRVLSVVLRARA